MADEGENRGATASAGGAASVRLPPFWPNSPAAWFRSAEAQFMIKRVTSAIEKYYLVLGALGEAQVDLINNLMDEEPTEESYQKMKEALVASHTLTPFQMVDRIVNMEPLNGRKPTELLAAMLRFRPKEDYHFFAYHFLQRMPREVRVLLARDCSKDIRALAEKADELMALHLPQQHDVTAVAAVDTEQPAGSAGDDDFAAAVQKGGGRKQQPKKKWQKKKKDKQQEEFQSPLCSYHVRYGDKAHRCVEPCVWPSEN
jgi:hypothetical protein